MRTIIAGSRNITSYALVCVAVRESGFNITQVVCGGARGVDLAGKMWAHTNNIPVVMFIPDWAKYGRSAGLLRNRLMANNADALIAVWDGKSPGTRHMIDTAEELKLKVYIHRVPITAGLL
jgi:predicted Rossmann fold nucleotide-binding protein DprA/Smf involved in DNA uptake